MFEIKCQFFLNENFSVLHFYKKNQCFLQFVTKPHFFKSKYYSTFSSVIDCCDRQNRLPFGQVAKYFKQYFFSFFLGYQYSCLFLFCLRRIQRLMYKKSFTVHPVYSDARYKQRENIRTQKNISHTFHSLIGSYFLSIYPL